MRITHFARLIGALPRWPRNVLAFVCGALCTLTLAPFYLFPLLIPSFTGLLWLLDGAHSRKRAFWDGWWWGWGFFITGLYWFTIALATDPAFVWMIPFALLAVTAALALYPAIACWLTARLKLQGITRIVAFSAIWTGVEFARGHLFTGFPWNLAGYSFGFSDASLQLGYLCGAYGLTFAAVLLGASFSLRADASLSPRRQWAVIGLLWVALAAGIGWGAQRLQTADRIPESERYVPHVKLRLVQGNIEQSHKWKPELQRQMLDTHLRLTQSPGLEDITHVIWPETSIPYAIKPDTNFIRMLGAEIPEHTVLIAGALRSEGDGDNWRVWNSLDAIDHNGNLVGTYDKTRLVPFGEFFPFRSLFPKSWLTPVGNTDFSQGTGAKTLTWPGLPPVSPLICYEVIFPGKVVEPGTRPGWLLNVTNDAWFGLSIGPHQHFAMSRMRAVEEGLPLVRVANTGISAMIDPYGRVVAELPLGSRGILDVGLSRPIGRNP